MQFIDPDTGEVIQISEAEYVQQRDSLLLRWRDLKQQLDRITEAEKQARLAVAKFAFAFNGEKGKEGTEYLHLGGGWKLKALFKNYYSMPTANNATDVCKMLDQLASCGQEGLYAAQNVVKWKPEINRQQYKQLPTRYKQIVDSVVKQSAALPVLEIIEP